MISIKEQLPPTGVIILVFSPEYKEGDPMRFRIIESQFLRICIDVTHWSYLIEPT